MGHKTESIALVNAGAEQSAKAAYERIILYSTSLSVLDSLRAAGRLSESAYSTGKAIAAADNCIPKDSIFRR